ncbi:AraC family transcriptional regulator [Flavobacterium zepuense]|uniref:AraC family transcriptional regulator n=2 Tax=Flavobacterium zepuense TaxID=2593302 RepID=A0A552VAU5_9FLAO|nr:AraC family transcriptional regulator [Flavobacterium zepuense]
MDTETIPLVKHGFLGQRMIVIPKNILSGVKKNELINSLYFTDIGFFPKAANHSVTRKNGSKQHILMYCYSGEGTIQMDTITIKLAANTFYIIPPGVSHHYFAHKKNPWSIYWLHFTGIKAPFFYDKFISLQPEGAPVLGLDERRIGIFENLINVMEGGYSANNLEYVNISLWQLLNSFVFNSFFSEEGKKNLENSTVETSIIEYMKQHLEKPLKINDVAAHFNYSPSHFFSLFKNYTGYSPINYFNHLKIQKACQYLSFTTMSVKEISYALGYNDPLYFSRLFKKLMSASPLQYRTEYKQ